MRFHDPWLLLLLLLLPACLWWERRKSARGGLKFSSVASVPMSFWTRLGPTLLLTLRGTTLCLFVVALARPQLGRSESQLKA